MFVWNHLKTPVWAVEPMETTPYIGALISLVSKAEIRYEGILFTIDTKESNIALQNGASLARSAGAALCARLCTQ